MSAREDANRTTRRRPSPLTPLVLATLAGVALGTAVALVRAPESLALFRARVPWTGPPPSATEWAEPARAGELARVVAVTGGRELHVAAARAPRARRLAEGLAGRRAAGTDALAASHAALREHWRGRIAPAPSPLLAPAVECASFLLAEADRRRDLAHALPSPYAGGGPGESAPDDARVAAAAAALADALAAADPKACRRALVALAAAEDDLFARGVPAPGAPAVVRGAAWRRAQFERADALSALAAQALESGEPAAADLAVAGAAARTLTLADAQPGPYAPLVAGAAPAAVALEPLPGAWARLVGVGGGLGGLVALLAALAARRLRPRRMRAPLAASFDGARDPSAALPWVHVVAGPSPGAALRAALELAAHALARRERVLVVDAGSLRLHERLGRDARWGLMECLQGEMPVLGLVQYAGRPGFYLLARGHASRPAAWAALGRCLDDARLHFGRVVFLVDRSTPRGFGEAIVGRPLEGWWGAPGTRLPQAAVDLSARLGIAFSGIDLSGLPKVSLESLASRVTALAESLPAPAEPVALAPPEPVRLPEPVLPAEPVVLDCDLQVRQRLRFLAWMRRVQSESRRAVAHPAAR